MIDRILGRQRKQDTGNISVFDSFMSAYRKDNLSKNGYDPLCGMFRQGGLLNVLPTISNVAVSAHTDTSFTVTADIDKGSAQTTVVIEYGLTTDYGSQQAVVTGSPLNANGSISAVISGLNAYTKYYFRVKATNAAGSVYSASTNAMNTTQLNAFLIARAAAEDSTVETINLTWCGYRTTASNAAVITLQGKNKNVIVNEKLSKEVVLNGAFDGGGTSWTATGSASVNTGKGYINGIGYIAQNSVLIEHDTFFYRVAYNVTERTGVHALQNANYTLNFRNSLGSHNYLLDATGIGAFHDLVMRFDSGTDIIGIDDVSFKMVGDKVYTAIGDSITSNSSSYAFQLMRLRKYGIRNWAVAGHSITDHIATQVLNAANDNADVIILALGTNDSEEVAAQPAIQAKIEQAIIDLKAAHPNATIYYMNVLPRWTNVGGGTPYARTVIRATIAAACAAQNITCWDTFTDPWIVASDTSDGVHPTSAGHTKIRDRIAALLPA